MTDSYIDPDETQIYGPTASKLMRERVAQLVPAFTAGIIYLADLIDADTAKVKSTLDASRAAQTGVRSGVRSQVTLKKEAKSVLGRFSNHLAGHREGAIDRKIYFTKDGTAGSVGSSASAILQAVRHIAGKLADESCGVQARAEWLADFQEAAAALGPAVEGAGEAIADRADTTPEIGAARDGWLQNYIAAKRGVECVLRLSGKPHLMKVVFRDLAVPSSAKVTEVPEVPEEPEPAAPAPEG